jgi:hypothetical protein
MDRRTVIRLGACTAVAGLAAPFIPCRSLQAGPRLISANDKLNHACIGVDGMGWVDLQNFLDHKRVQIVALCDVDANKLDKAAKKVPGARLYADWRELLQQEGDRIDSVNAAVPDHTHFSIAYSAIQRGKHVYCQKPLCHDVAEVRALTQAAVKKGVTTQLGTQVAATIHDRTGVQWLREGRIGKVTHAYLCSNRPGVVGTYRLVGPRPALGSKCVSMPRASSISRSFTAFRWMFSASPATLGISSNSTSSRTMRSSLSVRKSRASCATCAGGSQTCWGGAAACGVAVDFCASAGHDRNASDRARVRDRLAIVGLQGRLMVVTTTASPSCASLW